ncbi:MAG TPA: dienelactone hydrolase family protein [Microthrixaceae bacterium]|nr:dienelactone hydrolase family protein [Microthrixaceae bacterium]
MEPGSPAGTAYLVRPDDGPGPGVLVLHSWWGLTPAVKELCNRLADEGFVALAPDLLEGRRPETAAEAEVELAGVDPNVTAALLLSSVVALRSQTGDPERPIAIIGYSMGGSWALWLAARQPESVDAVVVYYGSQDIDFADLRARVLGHFAEDDLLVTEDQRDEMLAHLLLLGREVDFHRYPGTSHWFAEPDHPEGAAYDPDAAALAFERTLAFLRQGSLQRAGDG